MEKANHSAAQRWWRTVPDGLTAVQAQSGVDKLSLRMDDWRRRFDGPSYRLRGHQNQADAMRKEVNARVS
ncbi:hypothetical protein [Streptomyces hirsutus]|uniref:hypothetical protein n=1 Tax=Streptomyces hirsutus TaxID=35620 RepID=UPI00365B9C66